MANLATLQEKRITAKSWEVAQDLILNRPDLTFEQISLATGLSASLLKYRAKKSGWLNVRDLEEVDRANAKMNGVIKDIASQVNDVHEHASAMVEALQRSYHIEIYRDNLGHLHYRNARTFPDLPRNLDDLPLEEKESLLNYIEPRRLQLFSADLQNILNMKVSNITFVTKMIKGSLPKIDPITLDLGRRDADNEDSNLSADSLPDMDATIAKLRSSIKPNKQEVEQSLSNKLKQILEKEKDNESNS